MKGPVNIVVMVEKIVTDGRTDGRTDERTDGRTDGRRVTVYPPNRLKAMAGDNKLIRRKFCD